MSEAIFSPDQSYKVSFSSYEVRMSHWIDQPSLIRVGDNVCLFALNKDGWSARTVRWLDHSTVELTMGKYPGLLACTVVLHASTYQAEAISGIRSVAGPIPAVIEWIYGLV